MTLRSPRALPPNSSQPPKPPPHGGGQDDGPDPGLLRRLKLFAVCLFLSAVAFSVEPLKIVADTKLDLTINPLGFMRRALHLWDPAYFGQVQNQAYGYFFPNGPFHALLILADMPEWVVQRVWMALLLCAAFLGTVRLARALGIGTLHTQIVAGVAYALAPRVLTLLSYNSAELQPSMLLPWIILPLVWGTKQGSSPLRAAMLSGTAFLFCGGTNAASELAVLVVPLLYLLTRANGPRKWRLLGWWLLALFLVSFWWLVPLLLMGRYVFSFMPYTEDAGTTTSVTSLINALRGASNWMGYVPVEGQAALPSGTELSTTPWLIAVTAIVAGLGLAGIACRSTPERTFLAVTVLSGTAIVVSGHVTGLTALLAEPMRELFDGALSPFRNIHKFDAVIRLPVVLGLAYLPVAVGTMWAGRRRSPGAAPWLVRRGLGAVSAGAVLLTLAPIATVGIAPPGGFSKIPDYWYAATDWLDAHSADGMTMAVPGSARGEYLWGRPMDEPMQPLMSSRWTNHMTIPWGSAGVSRLMHDIDQRLTSGQGSAGLADTLARMGVRYLIVRNDLERVGNSGAWPARVHQALADSPGIELARGFGPTVGSLDRTAASRWFDQPYQALEVYAVRGAAPLVGTVPQDGALRVTGGPESVLAMAEAGLLPEDRPVILGDDPGAQGVPAENTVTTDTLRRQETVYSDVRRNTTNTLTAEQDYEPGGPAPAVMDPAWRPYMSVAEYSGIADVSASSSQAGVLAGAGERDPGRMPFAALDGVPQTSWRSNGRDGAVGEWLEVEFTEPREIDELTIAFERIANEPPPAAVDIITDSGTDRVPVEPTAEPQTLTLGAGQTSSLRVRVAELAWEPEFRFGARVGISELAIPGLEPARTISVPGAEDAHTVLLNGSTGTVPGCMQGSRVWTCSQELAVQGEDSYTFDRTFTLSQDALDPQGGGYRVSGEVVTTDPRALENTANRAGGYPKVTSSSTSVQHPAAMGRNALDANKRTVWYPDPRDPEPSLDVELKERTEIGGLQVLFPRSDAVTAPIKATVTTGSTVREGWLDGSGWLTFDPVTTDRFTISFDPPEGQPLEVQRVAIPDVAALEPIEDEPVRRPCGFGPALRVNGERVDTRIVGGDLEGQLDGEPLEYESCSDLELKAGENRLVFESTGRYRVDSALVAEGEAAREPVEMAGVESIAQWGPGERRFEVSAEEDSYLVVNENFNEGWEATAAGLDTPLTPVRLDGWRQAWKLPAGTSGTVTLRYTPDALYQGALAVGAGLAVCVVLVAAAPALRRRPSAAPVVSGRLARLWARDTPAASSGRLGPAALVPLALVFGAWVAGLAGVAIIGTALLVSWWLARQAPATGVAEGAAAGTRAPGWLRRGVAWSADKLRSPWTAVVSLGLAGLAYAAGAYLGQYLPFHGISRSLGDPLMGWVPQVLCLPALARIVVSLRGPGRRARVGYRPPPRSPGAGRPEAGLDAEPPNGEAVHSKEAAVGADRANGHQRARAGRDGSGGVPT